MRTAKTTCEFSVRQERSNFALAVQADGSAARYRLAAVRARARVFDLYVTLARGASLQESPQSIFHAAGYAVGMVICGSPGWNSVASRM